jgi:hypothetical protein
MSGRSIAAGKECGLRPNDKRLFKLAEPDSSVSAFDPIHGLFDGAARFCNDSYSLTCFVGRDPLI